jgi:hypothetical protein
MQLLAKREHNTIYTLGIKKTNQSGPKLIKNSINLITNAKKIF